MGTENPAYRAHLINTQWQKLVDTIYKVDTKDFSRDTDLALKILEMARLPISFEILRIGSIKVADAIMRIQEERGSDG